MAQPKYTLGEHVLTWTIIIEALLLIVVSLTFTWCPASTPRKLGEGCLPGETPDSHFQKLGFENTGAISLKAHTGYFFICNAYRIERSWYVTTAQCVENLVVSPSLLIRTNMQAWSDTGTDLSIVGIHVYEHYNSTTLDSNIALLKVVPYTYSRYPRSSNGDTRIASYASNKYVQDSNKETFWTFGWTKNDDCHIAGCFMMKKMRQMDYGTCQRRESDQEELPCNTICTVPVKHGQEDCIPDNGAPLLDKTTSLHGIKSWGPNHDPTGHRPQVYMQTNPFSDWMYQIMKTYE